VLPILKALLGSKSIGFLTLHETANNGYLGSYLITDFKGIPKEFRCTHSIKPDPLQKALYGDALLPHIGIELCGKPLIKSSKNKPTLIIVDKPFLLKLSEYSPCPVVYVRKVEDGEEATDDVEYGPEYVAERIEPCYDGSGPMEIVKKTEKKPRITDLIRRLCSEFDITEPFKRMARAVESLTQQSSRFR